MSKQKRSTNTELNKEVEKIQQPVPADEQMIADPAPVTLVEPGPVPQPPLKEATKEETAAAVKKQSGYDPKANQPTAEEKKAFEDSQKAAKSAK